MKSTENLMKIAFIITVNQIHLLNSFSFCLTQFEMVLALSLENLTTLHFQDLFKIISGENSHYFAL